MVELGIGLEVGLGVALILINTGSPPIGSSEGDRIGRGLRGVSADDRDSIARPRSLERTLLPSAGISISAAGTGAVSVTGLEEGNIWASVCEAGCTELLSVFSAVRIDSELVLRLPTLNREDLIELDDGLISSPPAPNSAASLSVDLFLSLVKTEAPSVEPRGTSISCEEEIGPGCLSFWSLPDGGRLSAHREKKTTQ